MPKIATKRVLLLALKLYVLGVVLLEALRLATPLMDSTSLAELLYGPALTIASAILIWIAFEIVGSWWKAGRKKGGSGDGR